MSETDPIARLGHMLDAAKTARQFAHGRTRAELEADEMLALAIVRLLEVIGEAASAVPEAIRMRAPKIPWKDIGGTRNRLVHAYFDVDLDIMWEIVTRDLPPLIVELERLLSEQRS